MNLKDFGPRHIFASLFPPAHVIQGLKINAKVTVSAPFCEQIILDSLESGKPTLVGRFGGTEARAYGAYLDTFKAKNIFDPMAIIFSSVTLRRRIKQLKDLSGVYPATLKNFKDFVEEYEKCILNTDVLGCWGQTFTWVENVALGRRKAVVVPHHVTSPWVEKYEGDVQSRKPWSTFLEGKKVLVISPFAKTFQLQYANIHKIFPSAVYPNFDPKFLLATQSLGGLGDNKNWKYHLERMKDSMEEIDFDIALISAGSYAFPLANHAKNLGKIGIHTGGELQLYFGVLGSRWKNSGKTQTYANKYWVRPALNERPSNWKEIEDGCYW